MSTFRNVGRSVLARALTFPITSVATLASTALIIAVAGPNQFAAISLVSTLVLLLPYSDLGLGASVINLIASGRSLEEKSAGVARIILVLLVPMIFIMLVAILGSSVFSWATVLGVDYANADLTDAVTTLVLLIFAMSVPLGVGQRILTGLGLNHIQIALSIVTSVGALAVALLLWWLGAPALYMAVAAPTGMLLAAILCTSVALKKMQLSLRDLVRPTTKTSFPIFSAAPPMMLVMVGLPLVFQSHRILLSFQSTPSELASYSLAMQFYAPAWSFVSVAGMAMWPIFASRRESAAASGAVSLFKPLLAFSGFGLAIGIGIFALAPAIGSWLSHGQISISLPLSAAVAALILVQAAQQVPGMYLTDARGLWFQSACIAVLAVAVVSLSWILIPSFGAIAPLFITAVGVLLIQILPGLLWIRRLNKGLSKPSLV